MGCSGSTPAQPEEEVELQQPVQQERLNQERQRELERQVQEQQGRKQEEERKKYEWQQQQRQEEERQQREQQELADQQRQERNREEEERQEHQRQRDLQQEQEREEELQQRRRQELEQERKREREREERRRQKLERQQQQQQEQQHQEREREQREQREREEQEERDRLERRQRELQQELEDQRQKHEQQQQQQQQRQEQERQQRKQQELEEQQRREQTREREEEERQKLERQQRQRQEQERQQRELERQELEQQERLQRQQELEERKRQEQLEKERLKRKEHELLQRQQELEEQERQKLERQELEQQERQKQEQQKPIARASPHGTSGVSSNPIRQGEGLHSPTRLEDGQDLTSSSSSTDVGATSSATSTDDTIATATPAKAHNADEWVTSEALARGSLSQPPNHPAPTASQSSSLQTKTLTGAWGANKPTFAKVLKNAGDQPVQPFQPVKRTAQSLPPQKPSTPSRRFGGKSPPSSTRPPAKTKTSVPSKPVKPRSEAPPPPSDLEISQLSQTAVRDYFLDPGGSKLTLESFKDSDLLDRIDFTDRLENIQAAAFGGLADVKKAKIRDTNILVAVKVLRAGNMGTVAQELGDEQRQRLRKRLAREMRIWLVLRHPRILVLLGFAFHEDRPCLLSPWYQNGNAKEYLSRNPKANRKALVVQVAEGLIYLHSRSPAVVHADLKPANILVDDNGGAVICDFGISKQPGEASTGLTTSQDAFMSLRYAAPEVLQNLEPSTKSDVYGFGCVALELFTGRCPHFGVINTLAILNRILQGPPSDPAQYPTLSRASPLWTFFRKCWEADPEKRLSMQEAHDELVRI